MARWLAHLGSERRMSAKTVEAYERDVRQFLGFLAKHLGGRPTLSELARLTPQDVRAFLNATARARWARSPPCARQRCRRRCRSRLPSSPPSASPTPTSEPKRIA